MVCSVTTAESDNDLFCPPGNGPKTAARGPTRKPGCPVALQRGLKGVGLGWLSLARHSRWPLIRLSDSSTVGLRFDEASELVP